MSNELEEGVQLSSPISRRTAVNMEGTPLLDLLSLLTTSIHTIESELKAGNMPPFTLDPKWHPLDGPTAVPTPRLHEARRVATASANMIRAMVQDVGTTMIVSGSHFKLPILCLTFGVHDLEHVLSSRRASGQYPNRRDWPHWRVPY